MTTTYHTPISTGAAANAATFNTPFSQLDSRLVQLDNALDTDGTLKAGAVDGATVIANGVVTDSHMAYPIRVAWAGVGFDPGSLTAGLSYTVIYDLGATRGTFAIINHYGTSTSHTGLVFEAWLNPINFFVYVRVTNVTNGTLAPGTLNAFVAIIDLAGALGESSESVETE